VLIEAVEEAGDSRDFLGHIGGDDFILVTELERIECLLDLIVKKFDERVRLLYSEKDRANGWIEVLNRQKEKTRFPIATLSIGVSTNERRELRNALEVSEIATELKKAAKVKAPASSNYIIDRRSS
jgi:GGDEF domain-containing protein